MPQAYASSLRLGIKSFIVVPSISFVALVYVFFLFFLSLFRFPFLSFPTDPMDGSLYKLSRGLFRVWQCRYFRVDSFLLRYFSSSSVSECRSSIDLRTLVRVSEGRYGRNRDSKQYKERERERENEMEGEFWLETKDRVYELRAPSKKEKDAWVECLSVFSGSNVRADIPERMVKAMLYSLEVVEKVGITVQGVFRVPGIGKDVKALVRSLLCDGVNERKISHDVFEMADAFKLLLRSCPQSLFTNDLFLKFVNAGDVNEVIALVKQLPQNNASILFKLFKVCLELQKHAQVTKMELKSLAIILGPSLIDTSLLNQYPFFDMVPLFNIFMCHFAQIFSVLPDKATQDAKISGSLAWSNAMPDQGKIESISPTIATATEVVEVEIESSSERKKITRPASPTDEEKKQILMAGMKKPFLDRIISRVENIPADSKICDPIQTHLETNLSLDTIRENGLVDQKEALENSNAEAANIIANEQLFQTQKNTALTICVNNTSDVVDNCTVEIKQTDDIEQLNAKKLNAELGLLDDSVSVNSELVNQSPAPHQEPNTFNGPNDFKEKQMMIVPKNCGENALNTVTNEVNTGMIAISPERKKIDLKVDCENVFSEKKRAKEALLKAEIAALELAISDKIASSQVKIVDVGAKKQSQTSNFEESPVVANAILKKVQDHLCTNSIEFFAEPADNNLLTILGLSKDVSTTAQLDMNDTMNVNDLTATKNPELALTVSNQPLISSVNADSLGTILAVSNAEDSAARDPNEALADNLKFERLKVEAQVTKEHNNYAAQLREAIALGEAAIKSRKLLEDMVATLQSKIESNNLTNRTLQEDLDQTKSRCLALQQKNNLLEQASNFNLQPDVVVVQRRILLEESIKEELNRQFKVKISQLQDEKQSLLSKIEAYELKPDTTRAPHPGQAGNAGAELSRCRTALISAQNKIRVLELQASRQSAQIEELSVDRKKITLLQSQLNAEAVKQGAAFEVHQKEMVRAQNTIRETKALLVEMQLQRDQLQQLLDKGGNHAVNESMNVVSCDKCDAMKKQSDAMQIKFVALTTELEELKKNAIEFREVALKYSLLQSDFGIKENQLLASNRKIEEMKQSRIIYQQTIESQIEAKNKIIEGLQKRLDEVAGVSLTNKDHFTSNVLQTIEGSIPSSLARSKSKVSISELSVHAMKSDASETAESENRILRLPEAETSRVHRSTPSYSRIESSKIALQSQLESSKLCLKEIELRARAGFDLSKKKFEALEKELTSGYLYPQTAR